MLVDLELVETQVPAEGRLTGETTRTLIHVSVRPKRQRDRRRRNTMERAQQTLASLRSYFMAHEHLEDAARPSSHLPSGGVIQRAQNAISSWLGK